MVMCVLCNSQCDPENPFMDGAIYGINPNTNRWAWMCCFCFEIAWEELTQDQKDEYMLKEEK